MRKAAITGSTGFVGAYLREHLESRGYEVWGTTLTEEPDSDGRILRVDVRDPARVHDFFATARPDDVYHLAAIAHPASGRVDEFYEVNLGGTRNVLEAAAEIGANVLVVTSAYVYGSRDGAAREEHPLAPVDHYGASKAAADLASRVYATSGLHVVRARPFNHTGPGQPPAYLLPTLVRQLVRIEAGLEVPRLRLGNLESVRDFTDVRDIVRGYHSLLQGGRSGEAYNLASGEGISVRDLANMLVAMTSVEVEFVVEDARIRASDIPYLVGDAGKALREVGWRPKRTLAQTVSEMFAHERGRLNG